MNHAARNPVTPHHTSRRRRALIWLPSGPMAATPAAATAFDVPTAGEPTYLLASSPPAAGLAASVFDLSDVVSGPAMRTSWTRVLDQLVVTANFAVGFPPGIWAVNRGPEINFHRHNTARNASIDKTK